MKEWWGSCEIFPVSVIQHPLMLASQKLCAKKINKKKISISHWIDFDINYRRGKKKITEIPWVFFFCWKPWSALHYVGAALGLLEEWLRAVGELTSLLYVTARPAVLMPLSVPGAPLLSGLSRCFQLFLGETPDEGHRKFSASCFCSALVENPESFKKQVGVTAERSIITSFFMMSVIWFYNIELFNIFHNWIFKNMKCYDFLDI